MWTKLTPLSEQGRAELRYAEKAWHKFRQDRAASFGRFRVDDTRPPQLLSAERALQKKLRTAYRQAKHQRRSQKLKAKGNITNVSFVPQ